MKHPFDGLISDDVTRRVALGTMVGAAAGLGAADALADPPVATTLAIGEEGGRILTRARNGNEAGIATRIAREEGGASKPASTEPFGEEAGRVTSRMEPGQETGVAPLTKKDGENAKASTKALGEEGGGVTQALREQGGVTTRALNEEGGQVPTRRANEDGIRLTLAINEQGGLSRGRRETGGASIVPVLPNSLTLNEKQLKAIWANMAQQDASTGVQACAKLYGAKDAITFLQGQLTVKNLEMTKADQKTIAKLIADLDSRSFAARKKAQADLIKIGPAAAEAVEKALLDPQSMEQKMRLAAILKQLKDQPQLLQAKRGIEVLVALRTPEAKSLLQSLAKGDDSEWLTQAAKSALKRVPN